MTVKQLIELLSMLPGELEVAVSTDKLVQGGKGVLPFEELEFDRPFVTHYGDRVLLNVLSGTEGPRS